MWVGMQLSSSIFCLLLKLAACTVRLKALCWACMRINIVEKTFLIHIERWVVVDGLALMGWRHGRRVSSRWLAVPRARVILGPGDRTLGISTK